MKTLVKRQEVVKPNLKAAKPKAVRVIKNSMSRREADQMVARLFESDSPNMTLDEVMAFAEQSPEGPEKQMAE